jgi:hypothetical protein
MTDKFPPTKQRPALLAFAEACGTRASALRRDECGDWAIFGTRGHIYAVPEGFQLMASKASPRAWSAAKHRLSFGKVTQDGDAGGGVILAGLPAKSEAETIRAVLGIPKRVEFSEGHLEILRARARKWHFQPVLPASSISGATL